MTGCGHLHRKEHTMWSCVNCGNETFATNYCSDACYFEFNGITIEPEPQPSEEELERLRTSDFAAWYRIRRQK